MSLIFWESVFKGRSTASASPPPRPCAVAESADTEVDSGVSVDLSGVALADAVRGHESTHLIIPHHHFLD